GAQRHLLLVNTVTVKKIEDRPLDPVIQAIGAKITASHHKSSIRTFVGIVAPARIGGMNGLGHYGFASDLASRVDHQTSNNRTIEQRIRVVAVTYHREMPISGCFHTPCSTAI